MKKIGTSIFQLITVFMLTLSCTTDSFGDDILPNVDLIGTRTDTAQIITPGASGDYIDQIIIDIDSGKIVGIVALYKDDVDIHYVAEEVNRFYKKWILEGFEDAPLMLWRVMTKGIAINLSINDDDKVQIIVLPFREHK